MAEPGTYMPGDEWSRTQDLRVELVTRLGTLLWGKMTAHQSDHCVRIAERSGIDDAMRYALAFERSEA